MLWQVRIRVERPRYNRPTAEAVSRVRLTTLTYLVEATTEGDAAWRARRAYGLTQPWDTLEAEPLDTDCVLTDTEVR